MTPVPQILTGPVRPDKLPSLPNLTEPQDAVVEGWYSNLTDALATFAGLETRLTNCTPHCRPDCSSDGFHDAASDKFNLAYRRVLDVASAMSHSEPAA